jgi:hypothetical protein
MFSLSQTFSKPSGDIHTVCCTTQASTSAAAATWSWVMLPPPALFESMTGPSCMLHTTNSSPHAWAGSMRMPQHLPGEHP